MTSRVLRWAGAVPAALALSALVGCTTSDNAGSSSSGSTPDPWGRPGFSSNSSQTADSSGNDSGATTQTVRNTASSGNGFNMTEAAFPTGVIDTSAVLLQKRMPEQVAVGQEFTYELVVTNISELELSNVSLTDSLPAGFRLASTNPPSDRAGDGLAWNVGTLSPGQSRTVTVTGAPTSTGVIGTCGTVTYDTSLCVETRVVEPALRLALNCTPRVMLCDPIELTYTVSNPGSGTARNVVVNEELPAGLSLTTGGRNIRYSIDSLAPGETESFTVMAMAETTGTFAADGRATAGGDLSADAGSCSITVVQPELAIVASAPERRFLGRTADFCFTVTNNGNGEAANSMLTVTMPGGQVPSSVSGGGVASGSNITWDLGTLAPGASREVCVTVPANAIGTARATARVEADCATPASDDAQTQFAGIPALLLEVIDVEDPIEVGSNVVYEIRVTNQGSAVDRNIRIVCTLEDTMQYVSASGASSGNASGRTISFAPVAALAPDEVAIWRVTIRAVDEGDVRFQVTMDSDELTREVRETESTNFYR